MTHNPICPDDNDGRVIWYAKMAGSEADGIVDNFLCGGCRHFDDGLCLAAEFRRFPFKARKKHCKSYKEMID